jgi:hypothetical protein
MNDEAGGNSESAAEREPSVAIVALANVLATSRFWKIGGIMGKCGS